MIQRARPMTRWQSVFRWFCCGRLHYPNEFRSALSFIVGGCHTNRQRELNVETSVCGRSLRRI